MRELIRRCYFRPYRRGMGPWFRLDLFDCGRLYGKGPQWNLGYKLVMCDADEIRTTLFDTDDYGCAPGHAIDSDAAVEGIMGFLTLRPGDADDDFFVGYCAEQLAFAREHAEALSCEVQARYCDENGNVRS